MVASKTSEKPIDILLIGAGIMSVTLAALLNELNPSLSIHIYEVLDAEAQESSNAWNNAGTGHAALCELNYTPLHTDGNINIAKALLINHEFDVSRQFWSYLVEKGKIQDPRAFIYPVPHCSFVMGDENVSFLRKRFEALSAHHCYSEMDYSEDKAQLTEWAPLVMHGRDPQQKVAMTHMPTGTDVNFGALTSLMLSSLKKCDRFTCHFSSRVDHMKRDKEGWKVSIKYTETGERHAITARFVFIGAGGEAVTLLHKSGIPEGKAYAGFPVSGLWLRSDNPDLCAQHNAKVYGKAAVGSPPMSVPHLDLRHIDGQQSLLFGPFAGFSTKFAKHGSYLDFVRSLDMHNILPILAVGRDDLQLTEYLIGQVLETEAERLDALRTYFPQAEKADWRLQQAGQRVQIIKPDVAHTGILEFGTELVSSADHSLAALLGASPGASTAVSIMLEVLERCFAELLEDKSARQKLRDIIPSYGKSLADDAPLCKKVRERTAAVLMLSEGMNSPQS